MTDLDVRIVELEPMRMACAHGFGESPELLATDKMLAFLATLGLTFEGVRWFGFNNPNPSPGSPNYGYDVWVPVDAGVEGAGEVTIKEFEGGLYAVTHFKDLNRIGEVWQQLVLWQEDSPYEKAHHQWLEHLFTHPNETPLEEFEFDLYLPIAK